MLRLAFLGIDHPHGAHWRQQLANFAVEAQTNQNQATSTTTFTSTAKTVPVGLVMSVTPQIGESGAVSLTVRPTISRRLRDVVDPNPDLAKANVQNLVPEIQVRRCAVGHTWRRW